MASKAEIIVERLGTKTSIDVFVNSSHVRKINWADPALPPSLHVDLTRFLNEDQNQVLVTVSYARGDTETMPDVSVDAGGVLRVEGIPDQPFQAFQKAPPSYEGIVYQNRFIVSRKPRVYPFGPLPAAAPLPYLLGQLWTSFVSTIIAPWYIPANFPRNTAPFQGAPTMNSPPPGPSDQNCS